MKSSSLCTPCLPMQYVQIVFQMMMPSNKIITNSWHNALVFCCPCKWLLTVAAVAFFQLLWRTCDTLTNSYNHILFMNKCNEMTSQNLACMINFILPLQTNENISKQTVHSIDWDNALSVLLLFILTCSQLDCPIYTYSGIDETIPQAFA